MAAEGEGIITTGRHQETITAHDLDLVPVLECLLNTIRDKRPMKVVIQIFTFNLRIVISLQARV